jgi:Icc protein
MKTKFKLFNVLSAVALTAILGISTVANASGVNGEDESNDKTKLSFGVISDIHLRAGVDDVGNPYYDHSAENKFQAALQDLNTINPNSDGLVIDGDLTVTGEQTDYDSMNKVLNETPHPNNTLFSMGNHEFYSALRLPNGVLSSSTFPNGVTEQDCINRYIQNTGMPSLYYQKIIKGYHFIVLGSEQSRITNWNNLDSAVLSDTQLQWLDNTLKSTPKNKPAFVFLHQPIPNTVAGSGNDIVNSDKLVSILNKYPQVILFSGHSHWTLKNQPGTMWQGKFTAFNDSCVVNPWNPTTHSLAGDSEGLYVQVYKDKVEVTGRDFTNKLWIDSYAVKIPSSKSSKESDQLESRINSN